VSWLSTPLPEAERDALLDSLADGLKKRGLAVPALFVLELHRPLGNTLAHGVLGLTPLLAPVLGVQKMQQAAALLAEPGSIDLLLERLSASPRSFPSRPSSLCSSLAEEGEEVQTGASSVTSAPSSSEERAIREEGREGNERGDARLGDGL
jgi:hypothetical protein